MDKKTGELKAYQNCCFVGHDETGKPRYCSMRSMYSNSTFKQDRENSDKTYGFTMEGKSHRVYEFEAPLDAISHANLCKLHGIDSQPWAGSGADVECNIHRFRLQDFYPNAYGERL